jgi:hypothetical protein
MKKDYMKPEGKVVAVSVRENIASSEGSSGDVYGVYYTPSEDGLQQFIQGSDTPATNTGNKYFDSFYDMVKTYMNGGKLANCRVPKV